MAYADLHMHSTASDGTFNPIEIPAKACQTDGLSALALTDHDTMLGLVDACKACEDAGLDFVPGVEITTKHDSRAVHMLGYFVSPDSKGLTDFLEANKQRRACRTYEMADRMHDAGFPVSSDDLRESKETPNRPSLGRLLVERGCVASVDEAFRRYLGSSSPYYVEAVYPDTIEAIHIIDDAGGFAFIAHPARYRVVDLIPEFAKERMVGLEAYHTLQSAEQSAELVKLAHEIGLSISGGSDWHGDEVHKAMPGACGLERDDYHRFLEACDRL